MTWPDWTAILAILATMIGVLAALVILWAGPPPARGRRTYEPGPALVGAMTTLLFAAPCSVVLWAVTLIGVILHER